MFDGRMDYVHTCLGLLADRRHPLEKPEVLDGMIEYLERRGLRLVSAQARRYRGLLRRDSEDLEIARREFEAMAAKPYVARLQTELGLVTRDAGLIDTGMDGLEAIGDVEQSARVAAERTSMSLAPSG